MSLKNLELMPNVLIQNRLRGFKMYYKPKFISFEISVGESLADAIVNCITIAKKYKCIVAFSLNGVCLTVEKNTNPKTIHDVLIYPP